MSNLIDYYKSIHEERPDYGASSVAYFDEMCLIIDFLNPKKILDFGCGKGALLELLNAKYPEISFHGYDPAMEKFSKYPQDNFDLVINTDVLEHIPENELHEILTSIRSFSSNVFFVLHHAKAWQILPNGNNAHVTIKPPIWYHNLFKNYFSNVYPLTGRQKVLSVVLTFDIPEHIFLEYMEILTKPEDCESIKKDQPDYNEEIDNLNNQIHDLKRQIDYLHNDFSFLEKKIKSPRRFFHIRYWKKKMKRTF